MINLRECRSERPPWVVVLVAALAGSKPRSRSVVLLQGASCGAGRLLPRQQRRAQSYVVIAW